MFRVFPRHEQADTIRALYGVIVAQARAPSFYATYLVPDTVGGRFDMIVLHLALVLRRLRREPAELGALGQSVFDLFCYRHGSQFARNGCRRSGRAQAYASPR
jgi:cytochrome b pre-mRNA-processing protein 3